MTNEEHELLVRVLCECLPHNVICETEDGRGTLVSVEPISDLVYVQFRLNSDAEEYEIWDGTVKPYLRPMSSMTEKEIADAVKYMYNTDKVIYTSNGDDGFGFYAEVENGTRIRFNEIEFKLGYYGPKGIDWLNKYHFDYRGLIPMGLALPATKGMYEIVSSSI